MKYYIAALLSIVAAPAYASAGSYVGMFLATMFVVVMLILYWLVVGEVGSKDKNKTKSDKSQSQDDINSSK